MPHKPGSANCLKGILARQGKAKIGPISCKKAPGSIPIDDNLLQGGGKERRHYTCFGSLQVLQGESHAEGMNIYTGTGGVNWSVVGVFGVPWITSLLRIPEEPHRIREHSTPSGIILVGQSASKYVCVCI